MLLGPSRHAAVASYMLQVALDNVSTSLTWLQSSSSIIAYLSSPSQSLFVACLHDAP